MRPSIRLGRIGGIDVGLNFSVIVIVLIIMFGLAFGLLPATYPGLPVAVYLVTGLVAAVLFLASLLAHELAHAIVARRNGVEVAGITLWLLGGVAQLRGEPRTPRADLWIAVVGPLTSVAAAVVFGVAAVLVGLVPGAQLFVGVLTYLAVINVILAVFNMFPAAPLDGGRVLRAALWAVWKDRVRAAVVAARAGRIFGFVLIGLGFLQIVTGLGFQGLWLILIGLFLVHAATAEEQQSQINASLQGVRVGDVMQRDVVTARPEEGVSDFIERAVLHYRFSTYPLVDSSGRFVGLLTLNRIRDLPIEQRPVTGLGEIACRPDDVPQARPDEPLTALLPRMHGCSDGRAVVLDESGRLIGLISPSDVSRALQMSDLRSGMEPYPQPRGADLTVHHTDDRRAA